MPWLVLPVDPDWAQVQLRGATPCPVAPPAALQPLERIVDRLSRAWGTVSHLKAVKDTEELRKVGAAAMCTVGW